MTSAREALHSSASVDWHTPPEILEPARELLGGFDLDPASSPEGNERVRARRFYAPPVDGLRARWFGRVWLNPPYGKEGGVSRQAIWSRRLVGDYQRGEVLEACLLVNAHVGTGWFARLLERPTVLFDERIRFLLPSGEPGPQPTHGNALVYFGRQFDRFGALFRPLGRVLLPCAGCPRTSSTVPSPEELERWQR